MTREELVEALDTGAWVFVWVEPFGDYAEADSSDVTRLALISGDDDDELVGVRLVDGRVFIGGPKGAGEGS